MHSFQIDLQTFLTLTDQDLKELGITTFGARRKMLLAISGVNDYGNVQTLCVLVCLSEPSSNDMWEIRLILLVCMC